MPFDLDPLFFSPSGNGLPRISRAFKTAGTSRVVVGGGARVKAALIFIVCFFFFFCTKLSLAPLPEIVHTVENEKKKLKKEKKGWRSTIFFSDGPAHSIVFPERPLLYYCDHNEI